MLVLKIIAGILVLWFLYWAITTLNQKVIKKYKYDFFEGYLFGLAFVSNLFIYFGHEWYLEAIAKSGDQLNGMIIMGIGVIGLLLLIYINIKWTNFIVGLVGSVIQIALFAIASYFAVFLIFIAAGLLANTRPVYNLNK